MYAAARRRQSILMLFSLIILPNAAETGGHQAVVAPVLRELRRPDDFTDFPAQLFDDRSGRGGRCEQCVPADDDQVGDAFLLERRHGRGQIEALLTGHGEHLHLAGLDVGVDGVRRGNEPVDPAAEEVRHERRLAAVGHEDGVDSGRALERLAEDVLRTAHPRRAVRRLPRSGFQIGDELLEVVRRDTRQDRQRER